MEAFDHYSIELVIPQGQWGSNSGTTRSVQGNLMTRSPPCWARSFYQGSLSDAMKFVQNSLNCLCVTGPSKRDSGTKLPI